MIEGATPESCRRKRDLKAGVVLLKFRRARGEKFCRYFVGILWVFCRYFVGLTLFTYFLPTFCAQFSTKFEVNYVRFLYIFPKFYLRFSYGLPTFFLRFSYVLPTFFLRFISFSTAGSIEPHFEYILMPFCLFSSGVFVLFFLAVRTCGRNLR